jgi:hypothetical protein
MKRRPWEKAALQTLAGIGNYQRAEYARRKIGKQARAMSIKTAVTLPSSTQLWLMAAMRRLHRLGERVGYELVGEFVANSSSPGTLLERVERFAEIDGAALRAYGGDRLFPARHWAVK